MLRHISQLYPPKPKFTEKALPSLRGKESRALVTSQLSYILTIKQVYIITGSNTGVGKELAQILYSKDATVYLAARSKEKALSAIQSIQATIPTSSGALTFLPLDLADLSTIKASVSAFLAKETRLDVLFNNAGVMNPPIGSKTVQGHELCLGVNNLGPFLFTKLLTPLLLRTATSAPPSSVRVIWVSSSAAEALSPRHGIELDNLEYQKSNRGWMFRYGVSKAGNYFHATEFAKRVRGEGVVSVALNPGNLDSELYRTQPGFFKAVLNMVVLWPPVYGAYTELFAGLAPEVTVERSGDWIAPWGRFMSIREDLVRASKGAEEGGTGVAEKFWEWNEEQVKAYL